MKRVMTALLALGLHWPALPVLAAAGPATLQAFEVESLAAIRQAQRGRPFVLALWSSDCPYCLQNLDLLAQAQRAHPALSIVTVATDSIDAADELSQLLTRHRLRSAGWAFGNAAPERLRYAIDPKWRGELPRTYLFDAAGTATAISGPLRKEVLDALR